MAASSPRSCDNRVIATAQPPPTSPTTLCAAVRAPSKNTSQNSRSWFNISIGRTSIPGWSIGHKMNEIPRCPRASGSVRASRKIHGRVLGQGRPDLLPVDHPLVAVERGPRAQRCEVGTGVRFGVALAPAFVAAEDRTEVITALRVGAPAQQRVPDHLDAEVVVRRTSGRAPPSRTPPPARPGRPANGRPRRIRGARSARAVDARTIGCASGRRRSPRPRARR